MVELEINNNLVELKNDTKIKYTKQIADIFDIGSVACSYTNSFEIPKTPNNTSIFNQLGISGDRSQVPYTRNNAVLKNYGFPLISKGWLNVTETNEKYKTSIIDGMIDFFKAIEGKTLGSNLDFSIFKHNKDLETVINSFTNINYRYIVADYGGKVFTDSNDLNLDYLIPSFSVKTIMDIITSTFGFTYNLSKLSYIENLWITYPKSLSDTQLLDVLALLHKGLYSVKLSWTNTNFRFNWDSVNLTAGSLLNNLSYIIPEDGSYNINVNLQSYYSLHLYSRYLGGGMAEVIYERALIKIYVNGKFQTQGYSNVYEGGILSYNLICNAGDVISYSIKNGRENFIVYNFFELREYRQHHLDIHISKVNIGSFSPEEFKDFSIKDFFKELYWRSGMTPVLKGTYIDFISTQDRINTANSKNLSSKFVSRNSENYVSQFAQRNIFKQKTDNDLSLEGSGVLYVNDANAQDEKVIANSRLYTPDKKEQTQIYLPTNIVNEYKIYQSEVKENNGIAEIKYKSLSNRFFFIRSKDVNIGLGRKLKSEILSLQRNLPLIIPIAENTKTLLEDSISENYKGYEFILNNFRTHSIEMALSLHDFLALDLEKPVYFEQENSHYLINKISYEDGKNTTGEFIKINKI